MQRWVFLAALVAVCFADPVKQAEPSADESSPLRYDLVDEHVPGPDVYRELDHDKKSHLNRHRIKEQNRIINDVYSPDYVQPTWILDYRYLKTGGRDYTRSDGGQILILPKGVKSPDKHKQFGNFDELLEFLRLQQLAEREKHRLHKEREYDYEEEHH